MLSTSDIIELYNNQEYDIIIDNLKLLNFNQSKPQRILSYAISTSNIELFSHTCTVDNLNQFILMGISNYSIIHSQFAHILSNNINLCNHVGKLINNRICCRQLIDPLLKIITQYVVNINESTLLEIFHISVRNNNLDVLANVIKMGINIKFNFSTVIVKFPHGVNIETFMFLEENNIDISADINFIGGLYCMENNIDGIVFCITHGADINYLLNSINSRTKLPTIKFLIEHGADVCNMKVTNLGHINDIDIIIFLVDLGLYVLDDLDKLILLAIDNEFIDLVKYIIQLGIDIHQHDELFLFFSVYKSNIEIIKLLLDNGADIYTENYPIVMNDGSMNKGSILLFYAITIRNKTEEILSEKLRIDFNRGPKLEIVKFLIKSGTIITEPQNIYKYYIYSTYSKIDEELLFYFLEAGLDLNKPSDKKSILEKMIYSGQITIIKLLLKYGADPNINNCISIRIAIKYNQPTIISILLKVINVTDEIQKLLDCSKKIINI